MCKYNKPIRLDFNQLCINLAFSVCFQQFICLVDPLAFQRCVIDCLLTSGSHKVWMVKT